MSCGLGLTGLPAAGAVATHYPASRRPRFVGVVYARRVEGRNSPPSGNDARHQRVCASCSNPIEPAPCLCLLLSVLLWITPTPQSPQPDGHKKPEISLTVSLWRCCPPHPPLLRSQRGATSSSAKMRKKKLQEPIGRLQVGLRIRVLWSTRRHARGTSSSPA